MILITCGLHGLCCLGCGCLVTAKGYGHGRVTQQGLRDCNSYIVKLFEFMWLPNGCMCLLQTLDKRPE